MKQYRVKRIGNNAKYTLAYVGGAWKDVELCLCSDSGGFSLTRNSDPEEMWEALYLIVGGDCDVEVDSGSAIRAKLGVVINPGLPTETRL